MSESKLVPASGDANLFMLRPQDILCALDKVGNQIPNIFSQSDLLSNIAKTLGGTEDDLRGIPEHPLAAATAIPLYINWLRQGPIIPHLHRAIVTLQDIVEKVIGSDGEVDIDELVALVKAFAANSIILDGDAGATFLAIRREAESMGYSGGNAHDFFEYVLGKAQMKGKVVSGKAKLIARAAVEARSLKDVSGSMFDFALSSTQHPFARDLVITATRLLTGVVISAHKEYKELGRDVEKIDETAVGMLGRVEGFSSQLSSLKEEMTQANQEAIRLKESVDGRAGSVGFDEIDKYLSDAVGAFQALRTAGILERNALINIGLGNFLGPVITGAGTIDQLGWVVDGTGGFGVVTAAIFPLRAGMTGIQMDTLISLAAVQTRFGAISQAVQDFFNQIDRELKVIENKIVTASLLTGAKKPSDI